MSRKRPATELSMIPSDPPEELPDMLVNVLRDMGASQQLLSSHAQSLAECMRIVNHLHIVLAQAHQSTSERIDRSIEDNPALQSLQSRVSQQGIVSVSGGQAGPSAGGGSFAQRRDQLLADIQGVIPAPMVETNTAGVAGAHAASASRANPNVSAAAMKESVEIELREALADARAGAPPAGSGGMADDALEQMVGALQSYRALQTQTLQPILQSATDATATFNERFGHLVPAGWPQLASSSPEISTLMQKVAPLLPLCPPAGGATASTCTSTAPTADGSDAEAALVACGYNTCGSDVAAAPATCGYNTCGSERDEAL